ncbi:RelA/SpoT domain-containing protein [Shewanella algae]|uniref:RelA/SpoT domain-containing protein n=1 Tax=Shewanella algae TaxID=38313 RepID=UPI00399B554D
MTRLFRTFLVFLLLLSARTAYAQPSEYEAELREDSGYSLRQNSAIPFNALKKQSFSAPRQPVSSLNALYKQAPLAQNELHSLLSQIANQSETELQLAKVKERQRAEAKVAHKLNNDPAALTDLVRATLIADNLDDLQLAFDTLNQQANVLQVKDRFAQPKASGYRDINLLLQLPKSGLIAEVQLHLREIAAIKNGAEHQVYEEVQAMEHKTAREQRPLSELELARIQKLRQESHKLYHKAWLGYKRQQTQTLGIENTIVA